MQRAIQVPSSLVVALNGIVVLFVVASVDVRRRLLLRFPAADGTTAPGDPRAPSVELEEVHV